VTALTSGNTGFRQFFGEDKMMTRLYRVDESHGTDNAAWECQHEAIRPHALCDSHETGDNELMSDIAPRSGKPASAGESVSVFPFLVISSLAFGLSVAMVAMSSLFGTANVETAAGSAAHVELRQGQAVRNTPPPLPMKHSHVLNSPASRDGGSTWPIGRIPLAQETGARGGME
jgi:hypothetical protein